MLSLTEYIDLQRDFYQACEVADAYLQASADGTLPLTNSQHFTSRALLCPYCQTKSKEIKGFDGLKSKYSETLKDECIEIIDLLAYSIDESELDRFYKENILKEYIGESSRKDLVYNYLKNVPAHIKTILIEGRLLGLLNIATRNGLKHEMFKIKRHAEYANILDEFKVVASNLSKSISKLSKGELEELVNNCPVKITNLIYYTYNACLMFADNDVLMWKGAKQMADMRSMLLKMAVETDEFTSDEEIQQILYGITHVVIGISAFYTKPVYLAGQELAVIEEWLRKGMRNNASWLTDDLLCECAVVLKYAGLPSQKALAEKAYKRMARKVKEKNALLPASSNTEHTASLFVMSSPLYTPPFN